MNGRDNLEEQLREVTLQLGHVEEQRLVALKDVEAMRVRCTAYWMRHKGAQVLGVATAVLTNLYQQIVFAMLGSEIHVIQSCNFNWNN